MALPAGAPGMLGEVTGLASVLRKLIKPLGKASINGCTEAEKGVEELVWLL